MNESILLPETLKSLRVLVIDDNEFMLDFVEDLLDELGINSISRARDGSEALAVIDEAVELPQLLICDLNMPGMDGIEFFRHLSSCSFDGGVIICSGKDRNLLNSVERLLKAHDLNFLGTLYKPIMHTDLLTALLRFVDKVPKPSGYKLMKMLSPEDISDALEAGYVDVFFQPKVSMEDHRVVGAECLVRLRHPQWGLVSPASFITVAEESGLIDSLTIEVFSQAMGYLGEWTRQGHEMKLSVNISMDNLNRLELPEEFANIAQQAGVEIGQVTLEITESRLMSNLATSLEIITRLRLKGFGLSINDFGTGYSNIENLKNLPFTELKVDRSFIFGATDDPAAKSILELSVQIAKALKISSVAEGAESQEDWNIVADAGCDEVQGYFIAKPMPAREFIAWKIEWERQNSDLFFSDRRVEG